MDYTGAEKDIQHICLTRDDSEILFEVVAYLYGHFDAYSWVGIYLVQGDHLILGPWRGKQATEHTKIPLGEGICGSAALSGKTEVIGDVSEDDRYLACFISTRSELVVPLKKNGVVFGEIDIDSDIPDAFSAADIVFLEKIADMLSKHI